ncbi:MAG: HAMP domain-containing sensor histidine kinase, partial [Bacteroidota bacterium]
VAEVAEDVMTTYHPMANLKNILLDYEIAPQTMAFADAPSVHAILRNLASNALKFTPRSGKVVISAGTEGDRVVVRVKDTGIGLTAEQLTSLFTVQRGSSRGTAGEKGTGLGLILVRDLAELNGGTIAVAAREGRGAVFTLTLPARS